MAARPRFLRPLAAWLTLGILFPAGVSASGYDRPLGQPLIVNYSPDDYNADAQNWAAVQDSRGVLFVANTSGVLEFDGQEWRLIRVGGNLAARSLAIDGAGEIFVGAFGDFGVLRQNETGRTTFVSLSAGERLDRASVGDVVTTVITADGVLFQSAQGVFVYRNGRLTVVRPTTQFHLGFQVRGRFFVRQRSLGLFELKGDRVEFVAGSEMFADDRVYCMLPTGQSDILIGSRDGGFRVFAPEAEPGQRFVKSPGFRQLELALAGVKASIADVLPDGRLAIGTTQAGLYICLPTGEIQYHLDRSRGLLDDVVYYVYVDRRGNLVLCLGAGIALVELASPFRFITAATGLAGSGNVAYRLDAPGSSRLFLGTYQGLYVSDDHGRFASVSGSQEAWALVEARGRLLFAHNDGVAEVETERLVPVLTDRLCLSLVQPRDRPDIVLVGTSNGLLRLAFEGGHWRNRGAISGFSQAVFSLSEDADATFWLHTQTGNGLIRLRFDDTYQRIQEVRTYTKEHGLPDDAENVVVPGRAGVFFGTTRGVYRHDRERDRFVPDERFPEASKAADRVRLLHEDGQGNVFVAAGDFAGLYLRQPDGSYVVDRDRFARLRHFRTGEYAGTLDDRWLLVAHKDGFILVDLLWNPPSGVGFQALVRRVMTPAGEVFSGNAPLHQGAGGPPPATTLPHQHNRVRFTFGAPSFEGANQTQYSFRLEGFDPAWSEWRRQNTSAYTNLHEGRYTFRVKARNAAGAVSEEAKYTLVILPPWYRTVWAYAGYLLAAVLALYGSARLYSRHLLKDKARLEALVAEKTRELREASLNDPLTGLRNRRFLSEVVMSEIGAFTSFKRSVLRVDSRRRPEQASSVFGVFLCDVDHFKAINDTRGHETGDLALRELGALLKSLVREDDFVIRWGGEEFLVILKRCEPAYVPAFARKVRRTVEGAAFAVRDDGRDPIRMTVSIGNACYPFYDDEPDFFTFEQTITLADQGLLYAKRHGRNREVRLGPGSVRIPSDRVAACLSDLDLAMAAGYVRIVE